MDRKGISALIGNSVETGKFPSAEAWLPNFTDAELHAEQARRQTTAQVSGNVAVKSSVRAQVESMLPAAYAAYSRNNKVINNSRSEVGRLTQNKIPTVRKRQFVDGAMDALDAPVLAYMESVKEESKGKTLWVPKSAANAEHTQGEIIKLAEVNAVALGKPLYGWDDRLKFLNMFTRQELSGNSEISDALVTHQFAPSTFTPRLYGTVNHQVDEYKAMRDENPGVNIHAPALAHSVGGWAIHAESGLTLPANFDTTYDRSVEVDSRPFNGGDCVPNSNVNGSDSDVDRSRVDNDSRGRAWVGQNLDLAA